MVTVKVRLFAAVRDEAGLAEETLSLEPPATLAGVWEALCARHPQLAPMRDHVLPAVGLRFASFDRPVADGDEVAFLPPVSGG